LRTSRTRRRSSLASEMKIQAWYSTSILLVMLPRNSCRYTSKRYSTNIMPGAMSRRLLLTHSVNSHFGCFRSEADIERFAESGFMSTTPSARARWAPRAAHGDGSAVAARMGRHRAAVRHLGRARRRQLSVTRRKDGRACRCGCPCRDSKR